jgi:hypothetical protein
VGSALQKIRDPHWVAGFTTGEGCFFIRLSNNPAKPRAQVQLVFSIGQHVRDKILMNSLVSYFGCGRYIASNNKNFGEFVVTKFESLRAWLISSPHSLINIKSLVQNGKIFNILNKFPF